MTEPAKPNGLEHTEMSFHKVDKNFFLLGTLEVVPSVLTRLGSDGTDEERFYILELGLIQKLTGTEVKINVAIPEDYRDKVVDAIKIEHFPNQPCTHAEGTQHG